MSISEELREELEAVARTVRPPVVSLDRLVAVGERERRRRQGLVASGVVAAVVLAVVSVPLVLGLRSGPSSGPPPADRTTAVPSPSVVGPAPDLVADVDGDGQKDAVRVSGLDVSVTLAGGATLGWEAVRLTPEVLGVADLGSGRPGLVLAGWSEGGRDSAIVLLVRDGALVRADPGGIGINRDDTQTMWVERHTFLHAVCLCLDGPQNVGVWRVELRPNGLTLRSVAEEDRCWDPTSGRDPAASC